MGKTKDQETNAYEDVSWIDASSMQYLNASYERFLHSGQLEAQSSWHGLYDTLAVDEANPSVSCEHQSVCAYFAERMKKLQPYVTVPSETPTTHQGSNHSVSTTASYAAVTLLEEAYAHFGHTQAQLGVFFQTKVDERLSKVLESLESSANTLGAWQWRQYNGEGYSALIERLNKVYCASVGLECMSIESSTEKEWLQACMWQRVHEPPSHDERKRAYYELLAAYELEQYLGKSYVGQKRFSLEGCDALIPFMDRMITELVEEEVHEVVIGMAHRGRLNVMTNIMGMPYSALGGLFSGAEGTSGSGDVKYHLGYTALKEVGDKRIYVVLGCNPSHLEAINAVTMGSVRARQDRVAGKLKRKSQQSIAVLVHGDASIAGQGVVSECVNMGYTECYHTGGVIHIVVNNQIGFTTEPKDARSSRYCTSIAHTINAPVLHVNAQDTDAVIWAAKTAVSYRQRFGKDIFIDLIGYRQHGHNESDDPIVANPKLYAEIAKQQCVHNVYHDQLMQEGVVTDKSVKACKQAISAVIAEGGSMAPRTEEHSWQYHHWIRYQKDEWCAPVVTSVAAKALQAMQKLILKLPKQFTFSRQLERVHQKRLKMYQGEQAMDWGACELLAYASILAEGMPVRLSGQDVRRGTFSHRHAVYYDAVTGKPFCALSEHFKDADFYCYNTALSEYAALGFEYGYAETNGECLVIWEAQFGDFVNNAQVMIDQFISSGWEKWGRMCGLVLLLPHGAEGQGPEHSSARLERFLQLCAQQNFQVCYPTTPAQYFHMIRRQMLRLYRRPLVVMSPKSLLRHPQATSTLDVLVKGRFEVVLDDEYLRDEELFQVKTLVLCSGKLYYDILTARQKTTGSTFPLVRLEQLYPFPYDALKETLQRYPSVNRVIWCQEEPKNQGAWYAIRHRIEAVLGKQQELVYMGKGMMASPAEGSHKRFKESHEAIVQEIINATVRGDALCKK